MLIEHTLSLSTTLDNLVRFISTRTAMVDSTMRRIGTRPKNFPIGTLGSTIRPERFSGLPKGEAQRLMGLEMEDSFSSLAVA